VPQLTEADREQIEARAHYATAETLFHKGDLQGALRGYQRAWRRDPQQPAPLEKIVPLAFSLGQTEVAVRYALLDAEAADTPLVRRLALYQAEQHQWLAALRLYRLWIEKAPQGKSSKARLARLMVWMEVARLEYMAGEIGAASQSFEKIQAALAGKGPHSDLSQSLRAAMGQGITATWEIMGRCHLEADRPALARAAFQQMALAPDRAPEANYWLAEVAAAEDAPLQAYDLLMNYFQAGDNPFGAAPYGLHARLLKQVGDAQGRLADLGRWSQQDRPFATMELAEAYAQAGDTAAAEALCRQLLARAGDLYQAEPPSHAPTPAQTQTIDASISRRAAAWLIQHLASQQRLDDLASVRGSQTLLGSIGGGLPDFADLDDAMLAALADESQKVQLLARLEAWTISNRTMGELSAGAWVARIAGQDELAAKLQQEFLRRSGEDAAARTLLWSIQQLFDNRPQQAIAMLRWGLTQQLLDENAPEPHFYLATALAMSEEHDAALAAARAAAKRAPDSADISVRVGWVLYNADRPEQAAQSYRQVIEDFGDDPDPATRAALKEARSTLSYIRLKQGDVEQAVEWLEQVLDEFPGDPGALNDLAYLWAERSLHLARAERMVREALAAEPDSAAYLDTLAWVQYRRGELPAALATIDRATSLTADQPDGELLNHRGEILAALGRKQEAIASWKQALPLLAEDHPKLAAEVREKLAPTE